LLFVLHFLCFLFHQDPSQENVATEDIHRDGRPTMKDEKDNQSDQTPPQKCSVTTNDTTSTSNLSSPSSAIKNCDAKDPTEESRDSYSARHNINEDPMLLSWESGSISHSITPRVTLKILVSNNMAGSIIGRSGQTIMELQSESSAKIRLSQSGDFFPGTNDRVCLIHGTLNKVKKGVALVLGKLYESQLEAANTDHEDSQTGAYGQHSAASIPSFKHCFTAKILIPSAACGMLIGKEGATIQGLKEKAGCSAVRLSQKVLDHSLPRTFERVLTVSAPDLKTSVHFTEFILEGFVRHPEICRYLNGTTSYSRSSNNLTSFPMQGNNSMLRAYSTVTNPASNIPPHVYAHPHSMAEIEAGVQSTRIGFDVQTNAQGARPTPQSSFVSTPASINRNIVTSNSSYLSPPQFCQNTISSPSNFGSTINLAVPESMIGSILGKRGQTLMEIQSESGAQIRVSQKNEFFPGTSNRIVTLSGTQESLTAAKNMIRKHLSRNS
jgi:KH domain.